MQPTSDQKPILCEPMIENCIRISTEFNNSKATIIASNISFCKDPDLFRLDVDLGNGHEWSIILTSKVSLITTSEYFVLHLIIFLFYVFQQLMRDSTLLPPLICHHIGGIRCVSDKFVLIISLYGFITSIDRNIQECTNIIDQLDTHHLVKGMLFYVANPDLEIESYKLLENGMPLIITSDMNFYVYNLNLKSWLPAVSREFLSSNIQLSQTSTHSHVSSIQNLLNGHGRSMKGVLRLTSSLQALCYQSFLEIC
ncbi:hypothetical protein MXB_973 [Myxobolus squamalis]|nr:hypothetical protein MXB_973 [Myxobolus squamalis]